jgi:hypothetical protein
MAFALGMTKVSIGWGLRVSEVWPTRYRRGHARRSFQIDDRADLTTHTQAKKAIYSRNDLATADTPECLNSKARGRDFIDETPINSKFFFAHAVGYRPHTAITCLPGIYLCTRTGWMTGAV